MSAGMKKYFLLQPSDRGDGYSRLFPALEENIIFKVTLGAVIEQAIVERRNVDLQYFREYLNLMKIRFTDRKYYDLEVIATQSYSQRLEEFFEGLNKYIVYKSADLAEELDDYYLLHLNKYGDVVGLIIKSLLLGLGCAFELERKVSQSTVFFDYQSGLFKHFLQMIAKLFGCSIKLSIAEGGESLISFSRDTAKVPLGSSSLVINLLARSDESLELKYSHEFFFEKGCDLGAQSLFSKVNYNTVMPVRQSLLGFENMGGGSSNASHDTEIVVERFDALQQDYISAKNIYNPHDMYNQELERRRTMYGSQLPRGEVSPSPPGYIDLSAYYTPNSPGIENQPKLQPNRVESVQYRFGDQSIRNGSPQQLIAHRFDDDQDKDDPWAIKPVAEQSNGYELDPDASILQKYKLDDHFMKDLDLSDSTIGATNYGGTVKRAPDRHESSLTGKIQSLIERSERETYSSPHANQRNNFMQEDGADAGTLAFLEPPNSPGSLVQPFSVQPLDIAPKPASTQPQVYRPFLPGAPNITSEHQASKAPQSPPKDGMQGTKLDPILANSNIISPQKQHDYVSFSAGQHENPLMARIKSPEPQIQIPVQSTQKDLVNSPESATRDKHHQLDLLAKKRPTASVELLQQISETWTKTKEEGANMSPSLRSTLQGQKKLDFSPLEARDSQIDMDLVRGAGAGKQSVSTAKESSSGTTMTRKHKFLQNSESEKNCLICSRTQKMTQMYYYDRCFFCSNCYGLLTQRFKNKGLENCAGCQATSTKINVVKFFLTNPFVRSQGSLLFTREKMMDKYFEYFNSCVSMPVKSADLDRVLKLVSNNIMTKVNTHAEVKVCGGCAPQFLVCTLCKFQIHHKEYFTNGKCEHGYCLDCLTLVFLKKFPHKKEFTCKGSLCWKKTPLDKALDYLLVKLSSLEEEFTGSREPRSSKV